MNYHFGTKQSLLNAAVADLLTPVTHDRARRLADLLAEPTRPVAEALVEALVDPLVTLFHSKPGGGELARLLGRALSNPSEEVQRAVHAVVGDVELAYLEALADALPHLPADELRWRFQSLIGVIAIHAVRHHRPSLSPAAPTPGDETQDLRRLGRVSRIIG